MWDCTMWEEKLKENIRDLRKSLDEIHNKLETSVKSSRATKRRNANKKRLGVKFNKWHYVLVAVAELQSHSKL